MGRAGQQVLPRGVTIRRHKHAETIQVQFVWNGKTCRETIALAPTRANLTHAGNLVAEVRGAIARGKFNYAEYFPKSKRARAAPKDAPLTIATALWQFITDTETAVARSQYSPATLDGYIKAVRHHLVPAFGSKALPELLPSDIVKWVKSLTLTAKSVRNTLIPLRAVLADALNDGLIAFNPLDRVNLDRLLSKTAIDSTYEVDPFTPAEVAAILGAAQNQARNFIQFAFATGMRTSELIALEWADVDWDGRRVHVQRAVVEKTVKDTKTRAGRRWVELDNPAYIALEKQRAWSLLQGKRIFTLPRTNTPIAHDQQIRKRIWLPAIKTAKVRYRNPYQTRHTFASTHLSIGANPWWLAQQMGHKDLEMILKRYGKWIPEAARAAGGR
jgi:integrase